MRFQPRVLATLAALAVGTAVVTPALVAPILVAPALAQDRPPSSQSLRPPGECAASNTAQPATGPAPASRDGTAPGNAGSTGWSGGTGGSQIGTNASGAVNSSPTWQPPTARGLDPISAPARPEKVC